jgi:esterase/lipase
MTPDEADRIVAELNIIFPSKKLIVEEVLRWEENLSSYSYESGQAALKAIEMNSKYWPSWAEFRQVIDPIARRLQIESNQLALQSGAEEPCTREENIAHIAEIRKIMELNKRKIIE